MKFVWSADVTSAHKYGQRTSCPLLAIAQKSSRCHDTAATKIKSTIHAGILRTLITLSLVLHCSHALAAPEFPRTMIWAWERPEDLSYMDPAKAGVACFARRYRLSGERIIRIERTQILRAPRTAKRIAVVRIEPLGKEEAALSLAQRQQLVKEIALIAKVPNVSGIQIDFDARITEREFYRALLQDLRNKLGTDYFISMTALASWCIADNWVNDLPVNEIVPMLFDMGADSKRIRGLIADKQNCFSVPIQKLSLGISTREPDIINMFKNGSATTLKNCQRVYIFSPKSWTRESYSGAISGVSF